MLVALARPFWDVAVTTAWGFQAVVLILVAPPPVSRWSERNRPNSVAAETVVVGDGLACCGPMILTYANRAARCAVSPRQEAASPIAPHAAMRVYQ